MTAGELALVVLVVALCGFLVLVLVAMAYKPSAAPNATDSGSCDESTPHHIYCGYCNQWKWVVGCPKYFTTVDRNNNVENLAICEVCSKRIELEIIAEQDKS